MTNQRRLAPTWQSSTAIAGTRARSSFKVACVLTFWWVRLSPEEAWPYALDTTPGACRHVVEYDSGGKLAEASQHLVIITTGSCLADYVGLAANVQPRTDPGLNMVQTDNRKT